MIKARKALLATSVVSIALLSSQIAVGVTETDLLASNDNIARELPSETKEQTLAEERAAADAAPELAEAGATEAAAPVVESKTFVAEGAPVSLENLGVTITPPAGWEVSTNTGSLSVVMREPRVEAPSYDKPKYQRNITVAAVHKASPIDEKRAEELKAEMMKTFTADSLVSDFQIVEHKFFNYRGTNDGLLVYSSLSISGYPMMQMHVLVSGQAKQFLLTYTDLSERFTDQKDGSFEKAWATVTSIEVTGLSPNRYDAYMQYGAGIGGFLLLCIALLLIRRRATRFDYASEADALIEDEDGLSATSSISVFSTMAGGWNISKAEAGDGSFSDFEFTTEAPRTRRTEYVSNY